MHICVGNLTIIGSDNGLSPGRRQAITWTNVGILLIGPIGTNFSEMLIEIHTFSFKKIHLKMSSGKWRPFCFGLNVLSRGTVDNIKFGTLRFHQMWEWAIVVWRWEGTRKWIPVVVINMRHDHLSSYRNLFITQLLVSKRFQTWITTQSTGSLPLIK